MENLGLDGVRDWFYVIGLVGFGLTTMMPVFWVIWKWGPEVGKEAKTRETTWLTSPASPTSLTSVTGECADGVLTRRHDEKVAA